MTYDYDPLYMALRSWDLPQVHSSQNIKTKTPKQQQETYGNLAPKVQKSEHDNKKQQKNTQTSSKDRRGADFVVTKIQVHEVPPLLTNEVVASNL